MDKAYLLCNEYYTLKDFDNKIKFLSYHSFNTSEYMYNTNNYHCNCHFIS